LKKLSDPALALLARVKQTRHGVEVELHDQMAALEKVARHLGMFNDKLTLAGERENPLELLIQQIQGSTLRVVGSTDQL
jgi:phage terminase small subunit